MDIDRLFGLTQLTRLELDFCFGSKLTDEQHAAFQIPSKRLPLLQHFLVDL